MSAGDEVVTNNFGDRSPLDVSTTSYSIPFGNETQRRCCVKFNIGMSIRDPEKNFKVLWETFNKRYPFFQLRNVNWKKQHDTLQIKSHKHDQR